MSPPRASVREIKLARHPDYHEGKIVFSYLGNLWVVDEDGSNPRRLTVNRAHDIHPRFSPDGKWIAFSSSRYGNYDVFVIPAEGGEAKRLTYHSADDTVVGWSRDSKRVLFSSVRGRSTCIPAFPNSTKCRSTADWSSRCPPTGATGAVLFARLARNWPSIAIRWSGGASTIAAATPPTSGSWTLPSKTFRKLLDAELPDEQKPNNFWPMYGNGEIYFVSDREVKAKAATPEVLKSLQQHLEDPRGRRRSLCRSPITRAAPSSGRPYPAMARSIVYEENFGLWKLDLAAAKPVEIKINITADDQENNQETLLVNGEADAIHLSPSGKRAVISTHGELFTIATDRGDVRRLTKTPRCARNAAALVAGRQVDRLCQR